MAGGVVLIHDLGLFTGSAPTYGCHSSLHAALLNAPASAHNDTTVPAHDVSAPPRSESGGGELRGGGWKKSPAGPCLLFMRLLVAPGAEKNGS